MPGHHLLLNSNFSVGVRKNEGYYSFDGEFLFGLIREICLVVVIFFFIFANFLILCYTFSFLGFLTLPNRTTKLQDFGRIKKK